MTYSSIVSRDSVCIAFLLASDLRFGQRMYGICRETIWTVAGPEFGPGEGKVMFIKKALYGLKTSLQAQN
jgi:hypothetical protein